MVIESALRASYARLPRGLSKPVEAALLSAYWRMRETELLTWCAIQLARDEDERAFWRRSLDEEFGHAAVFQRDLLALWGEERLTALLKAFVVCPAMAVLVLWARRDLLHVSVYRAYVEFGLMCLDEASLTFWRRLAPETMRLHEELDKAHSAEILAFLTRFDVSEVLAAIAVVEAAFVAEIEHTGLAG